MQATRIVNFYSKDMLIIFKVQLGKRNLIEAVIAKLAQLHNYSKQKNQVAIKLLLQINIQMLELFSEINKKLKTLKSKVIKNAINEHNTRFILIKRQEFIFGNNTIFNLLRLIEVSDLYFSYLRLIKSSRVFNKTIEADSLININRKKLFSLLSNIATLSLKDHLTKEIINQ